MIKADNTQKRCFVACDEQTRKDGRCSCLSNSHQNLQLLQPDVIKSVCDRVNNFENNRCINCGAKSGHKCELQTVL